MAKKRRPGRPPKKTLKDTGKKSASFWRGAGAVLMIVAGIVLAFGAIISAPLPHNLWNGAWWAFGAATLLVPFALVYLGTLKFVGEDQQIPLAKLVGTLSLLVFLAGMMHTLFLHTDAATGGTIGGHGGNIGKAIGNALGNSLGRFLASLVFLILAIFAVFFTFGIEPQALLKLGRLFKREKVEGEAGDEDLAALKTKMGSGFQVQAGVPIGHTATGHSAGLRNRAQQMTSE